MCVCVCVLRCVLVLHRASRVFLSVSISPSLLPPADHMPRSVSGGPSSPGRGYVSSTTDCTTCSGLGTDAHADTHTDVSWQAG